MGRLIIDGNAVFEIDEECLLRRKPAEDCELDKYLQLDKIVAEEAQIRAYLQEKGTL